MCALKLASRLDRVKPSVTLLVSNKTLELQRKGIDVASFGAGEPNFDTPDHIKNAAKAGLDRGVGKYTQTAGLFDLRSAISQEMKRVHDADYSTDQVLVSCGAKHSLYNAFMALIDDGDEAIVLAPFWVSYPEMVALAGGKAVIVSSRAEENFVPRFEDVERAVSPRTKCLILNSPSNPTGNMLPPDFIAKVAELAVRKNFVIISDDIYRALTYGDAKFTSVLRAYPKAIDNVLLVDGVSKSYAMTGWRIGYACGPKPLISAMGLVQGQSTSNPTHVAQVATIAALTQPQSAECVENMRLSFEERRNRIVELLRAIPHVKCILPDGAFYAFPDVSAYVGKKLPGGAVIKDDVMLCDALLETALVAVTPGSGFGAPGHIRLSYACSLENIEKGLDRMKKFFASLEQA